MKAMVEALCSDECEGRKPGTKGGLAARKLIVDRLRRDGLDPVEQPVPMCKGANVIARLPGDIDRWVLVGAHYDHLGREGGKIFRGADDNAAAIAILLEVSARLSATRPVGRGVLLCAFDGEEPPYFLSGAMGSQFFVKHAPVPLESIDMMVCMDLVGHAFGGEGLPDGVRSSMFALGAERSEGTALHVDAIAAAEPGVIMRRADAEVIPPLSDYDPFWRRRVPFLFLSSGRSRYYHTPGDTPDRLDYGKMAATARWLERFVRETCARPEGKIPFLPDARDDAATLRSVIALTEHLSPFSEQAQQGQELAFSLLSACDGQGSLPHGRRAEAQMLVGLLESNLA
jgi:hypothetical protein